MAFNFKQAWNALFEKKSSQQFTYDQLGFFVDTGLGDDSYPLWNFPLTARLAFEQNVVAYKGVMHLSKAIGGLTWYLEDASTGNKIDNPNHPLLKLLACPNPAQGRSSFFQHAAASKILDGNIFIELVCPRDGVARKGNAPLELWIKRPDWVQVIPGDMNLPLQYIYTPGGADVGNRNVIYPVNQIDGTSNLIHIQAYSPLYEETLLRGLSPMRAAALQILTHNAGQKWNKALLENSARPSGAFVTSGTRDGVAELTQEQVDDLKKQIREFYASPRNAGKPLVLAGGLKFDPMSMSPKDADWNQLKDSAARDISNVIGIPSQLLGIPGDNTYSNYQEARLSFYEDTVLPEARQLRDELNRRLTPLFGPNLRLEVDEDDIPALSGKRDERRAAIDAASYLTVNEKRAAMGYNDVENGDVILVPTLNTTLDATAAVAQNKIDNPPSTMNPDAEDEEEGGEDE